MTNTGTACLLTGLALVVFSAPSAAVSFADAEDFADLSLEDLANLQISSVSRKPEPLADAAASVFVITAEDIRRVGATTLPEALRLAPNLLVVRTNASMWAISARGLNDVTATKLLVLVDGRPIYSPLHSGVFWDTHDIFMPDVERIEVISGPNATTWGSNAVNGVINVITRHAGETAGTMLALNAGEADQAHGIRHGGRTAGGSDWRIYGKYVEGDASENDAGADLGDAWDRAQAGFRLDFGGAFTVQGDVYDGAKDSTGGVLELSGGNVLSHWQRELAGGGAVSLLGWYEHAVRQDDNLKEDLDIVGINAQHRFRLADDHSLVWGSDIRYASDHISGNPTATLVFIPERRTLHWISLFIQDDIRLGDNVTFTVGARAEDNSYTGLEFMPNLRLAWTPAARHTLWTSLAQAVRTPSRIDRDLFSPPQPPFVIAGGPDFDSEVADVLELGWRAQPAEDLSFSLTAFHHDYDRLRSVAFDPVNVVATFANQLEGTTTGLEGWLSWQPLPSWRLSGGVFLFDKDIAPAPGDISLVATEGNDPEHQWQLRSSWDFAERGELELFLRGVGELPDPEVPAYTTLDTRFAWRLTDDLEVALKVQNLLDDEYAEFGTDGVRPEYGRQAFLQLRWNSP